MRLALLWISLVAPSLAAAGVLNVEFKFTPYTGDLKQDSVQTVAGKARVFLNNALVAEQEVSSGSLPVLFDEREIAPSVWVPVASMGPALRKGHNRLRIEFLPGDAKTPYMGQLSWATVNDEVRESDDGAGSHSSSNQSGEGKEDRPATGTLVFERDFDADFAKDRAWHHYPAVTALGDPDKATLLEAVRARTGAFKPAFEAVYEQLGLNPAIHVAELRKMKCLDAAYAAGVRVALVPETQIEFSISGGPEVVLTGKDGKLFEMGNEAVFSKIKGDDMQMCAGMVLSIAYPQRLAFVRNPGGAWELAY
ncbi:MAG: hypothetical protein ABI588_07605 [Arenimonas sp.]